MRTFIFLLSSIAIIGHGVCQMGDMSRKYFPEEEDEFRVRNLWWEDEEGNIHMENLFGARMEARANINDVTFYLFTKMNPVDPEIIVPSNFDSMIMSSNYKKGRKNVFVVHGWNNDHTSPINTLIRDTLLSKYDLNVFVVDWSKPANKNYFTAKGAVKVIGKVLGDFIYGMISHYGITSKSFNLIGHSLGAHIVGCAGAEIKEKVNYIIGLDPAGPLFSLNNKDNRIDSSDGDFVQIVHTNGGNLAFSSSLGHADYYPNGGSKQPGCGIDFFGTCAHSRSYQYLAESLEHPGFIAYLCNSFSDFKHGKCDENHQSIMGTIEVDKRAQGDYYLQTNAKKPFALF